MKYLLEWYLFLFYLPFGVNSIELPGTCNSSQYYDPSAMMCQSCPTNASMVTSLDGFSCTCEEHSVPMGPTRCRPCNATEVVSSDGRTCVPRRCQTSSGRVACRKCPSDYISVTQNLDGTSTKEVQCIKCARGYKAINNVCVRCDSCACPKQDIVVRGRCVPKRYVNERPKYDQTTIHPNELLDVVKEEYFCTQNDLLACRSLANDCIRSFYSSDLAGPCRLWVQPKLTPPKGLPKLTLDTTSSDKDPTEIGLTRGMETLQLVLAVYTATGGLQIIYDPDENSPCFLPLKIVIGNDISIDCEMNISKMATSLNETLAPFIFANGDLKPLPISLKKPGGLNIQVKPLKDFERRGYDLSPSTSCSNKFLKHLRAAYGMDFTLRNSEWCPTAGQRRVLYHFVLICKQAIQPRGTWSNSKFRRYFLVHNTLSITANITNTIYLRTFLIRLRIERNKFKSTSLRLHISLEAQYATNRPLSSTITTTLRIEHEMPSAGVLRGMEIWGGVLGAFLSLYAVAQWRGNLRRGGLNFSLIPYLAGAVADTLYFAAWFSTLHALAAEAGTLGMTLPLSHSEEHMVKTFIYSAVGLKALKVAWVNYSQCKCDIFFLDWSEYNPPIKDILPDKSENWKTSVLAREWSRVQTIRRACPTYTVALALIISHLIYPWQSTLLQTRGYRWATATIAWWAAYAIVITIRYITDKILGPPTGIIPTACRSVGLSLIVFQEEFYAHYVHGRNDDSEARSLVGPLAACRVVCAPQLRTVYKQLSTPGLGDLGEKESKRILLSKFLAAFFERALDGLSWVASERTIPERLLDVELTAREAGNTSALLYDSDDVTGPSYFAVIWWGEEWTLGTFDAMLFGAVFIATTDCLLAALTVLIIWKVIKLMRSWLGNKNQIEKTDIEIPLHCY